LETLAPVIGSLGFVAFVVGCCMFLPLTALRKRRRLAKWLAIGGFIAFAAALVADPTPAPSPSLKADVVSSPNAVKANQPGVVQTGRTTKRSASQDQPSDVMMVLRQTMITVVFCTSEIEQLQRAIDKAGAGAGTPMQAYSAAHTAERDCRKMMAEFADSDRRPFLGGALNAIYAKTLPACKATVALGKEAAGIAKVALDEDSSMKTAQRYLDKHREIAGKVAECKLGLQGVAEEAGISEAETDFLKL
jgi:hypothetical protein